MRPAAPAPNAAPRVLHVAAEVFPLVKTGGLADVVAALPVAQVEQGAYVRLLLPGYPAVIESVQGARQVIDIGACFGALRVLTELRALDPDVRAIVMSGYSDDVVLHDWAKCGFVAALTKPFDESRLREVLGLALAQAV